MKPIDKLLTTLIDRAHKCSWHGHEKDEIVSCIASEQGFEITIAKHDYTKRRYGPGRKALHRRRLSESAKHWIEISIKDDWARFGRRAIADLLIIHSGDENFAKANQLFEVVFKNTRMFKAGMEDRLSEDQSLLAFCAHLAAA